MDIRDLVSTVLELPTHIIGSCHYDEYEVSYYDNEDERWVRINIYEFADKCKKFALEYGYCIQSYYEDYHLDKPYAIVKVYFDGDMVWHNYLDMEYEYEEWLPIIKASKWVLEMVEDEY